MKKVINYFKNVKRESKKIHWAKAKDMFSDFRFNLLMAMFLIGFFALLDYLVTLVL